MNLVNVKLTILATKRMKGVNGEKARNGSQKAEHAGLPHGKNQPLECIALYTGQS